MQRETWSKQCTGHERVALTLTEVVQLTAPLEPKGRMSTATQTRNTESFADISSARTIPLMVNPWGIALSALRKVLEERQRFLVMAALAGAVLAGMAKM